MDPSPTMDRHARRERILSLFLEQTVARGTPYWWRPRGFSMSPTILDGERVLIAPVDSQRLRLGDVVKFRFEGRLTLHRLVGRARRPDGGLEFAFRGDNGTDTEARVPASSVIGLAVAVERGQSLVTLCSLRARFSGLPRMTLRTLYSRKPLFYKIKIAILPDKY